MTAPVNNIPTPVADLEPGQNQGLIFPTDGSGLTFDAGYPLTFPSDPPGDLSRLFPTIMPQVEQIVYQTVNDACQTRATFPPDGQGLPLPLSFRTPDISLFLGKDGTYTIPAGTNAGQPIPPIPVNRGWPAYPGEVPAIGVTEAESNEDPAERLSQAGFAGDVYATDALGNVLATCAYYSEPLRWTVVVELIHVNRDERDRLHDQLRRVIYPLRQVIGDSSEQVWDVTVSAEKQELPIDEQPLVMYLSLFTVEVTGEALIPTEIVTGGAIERLDVTVTPTQIDQDADSTQTDLT